MAESHAVVAGLYLLIVHLPRGLRLRVGAMGLRSLPAGWYIYVGSAKRGLPSRLARHALTTKPLRWHVDYLTAASSSRIAGAVVVPGVAGAGGSLGECALSRRVGRLTGGQVPVPGFGASDCREGCPAHLWYSEEQVTADGLVQLALPEAFALSAASLRYWARAGKTKSRS